MANIAVIGDLQVKQVEGPKGGVELWRRGVYQQQKPNSQRSHAPVMSIMENATASL